MSLGEICEPFFLFVCRMNAAARKGVALDERHIRSQLEQELAEVYARAASAGGGTNLRRQVELIERPLIYFFDSMMTRGPLGRNWRELSVERGWRGYEQDFFVLLGSRAFSRASPSGSTSTRTTLPVGSGPTV